MEDEIFGDNEVSNSSKEESSSKTITNILIFLAPILLAVLIIGFFILTISGFEDTREYHIYMENCNLGEISACGEMIEVENMTTKGFLIPKSDLDDELIVSLVNEGLCNNLKEDAWGCGTFLVKKE